MRVKAEVTGTLPWGLLLAQGPWLLVTAGCGDTSTTGDADDVSGDLVELDAEDGDIRPDEAEEPQPDSEDAADEEGPPPVTGGREIIASSVERSCIGCDNVSWCHGPPLSDMTVLTFDCAPNNDTGLFFAAERWEWHGRELDVDVCATYTGSDLDAIIDTIEGVTVLDAGPIAWSGDMGALTPPLSNDFHDVTHNYSSVARPVDYEPEVEYVPGASVHLEAPGGADVSAFSADGSAVEPFEILTPSTDESGQIRNIATDAPLEVTWSGGADFDDVIIMLYFAMCPDEPTALVMCRASNDGAFTIPYENLAGLEWPNVVLLYMSQSLKIPIEVDELADEPAWSVRSHSMVPVYRDPDVTPPPFECDAVSMPEGFVGNPCTDDSECGGGCCLEEVMDVYFYENYCTIDGCNADATCPADSVCVLNVYPAVLLDHYCAMRCTGDTDCRFPEYACMPADGGETVCVPNFW